MTSTFSATSRPACGSWASSAGSSSPPTLTTTHERAGFNGAIDRRPAAIARAATPATSAAAVRGARAAGRPFTVRGGGRSVVRPVRPRTARCASTCAALQARRHRDRSAASCRVGGGALLGELDRATQEHGLAVPAGQITPGVGGLTSAAAMGWLMRGHGLTIDSLLGAEVVLADGRGARQRRASPDLLWALRGGGGDFGAVTRFDVPRASGVGPMVLGGMLAYPSARGPGRGAGRLARELMDVPPRTS